MYLSKNKHSTNMDIEFVNYTSTSYGGNGDNLSPFVTMTFKARPCEAEVRKNVIFVIDTSGSMDNAMQDIKSSILAFSKVSEIEPVLISFNDNAELLWPSEDKTLLETVNNLGAGGMTNMGSGILKAFNYDIDHEDSYTWIVIFTDGDSNVGEYQTLDSFLKLKEKKPKNTKLITIGYGKDFEVDVLMSFGDFTHIENTEMIPTFMGSLANEIKSSMTFDIQISGDAIPKESHKIKIGSTFISSVYPERDYIFGFIPSSAGMCTLDISFSVAENNKLVRKNIKLSSKTSQEKLCPEPVRKAYYQASTSRMIMSLYKCNGANLQNFVANVKKNISRFDNDIMAKESIATISRILEKFDPEDVSNKLVSLSVACSGVSQVSYVHENLMTPSAIKSARAVKTIASTISDTQDGEPSGDPDFSTPVPKISSTPVLGIRGRSSTKNISKSSSIKKFKFR